MVTFAPQPIPPSNLSPKPAELPGIGSIWRHKKGEVYKVLVVSRHTEDPDAWLVTYEPIVGGEVWTRAYTSFQQLEWPAFSDEDRFTYVGGPRTAADEKEFEPDPQVRAELPDESYLKILAAYMAHVVRCEGTDFLGRANAEDLKLTNTEFTALCQVAIELDV